MISNDKYYQLEFDVEPLNRGYAMIYFNNKTNEYGVTFNLINTTQKPEFELIGCADSASARDFVIWEHKKERGVIT